MASEAGAASSSSVLDLLSQGSICGSDARSGPLSPPRSLGSGEGAWRHDGQAEERLRADVDDEDSASEYSEGWRLEPLASKPDARAEETGECDLPLASLDVNQRQVRDHLMPMESGRIECLQA